MKNLTRKLRIYLTQDVGSQLRGDILVGVRRGIWMSTEIIMVQVRVNSRIRTYNAIIDLTR